MWKCLFLFDIREGKGRIGREVKFHLYAADYKVDVNLHRLVIFFICYLNPSFEKLKI